MLFAAEQFPQNSWNNRSKGYLLAVGRVISCPILGDLVDRFKISDAVRGSFAAVSAPNFASKASFSAFFEFYIVFLCTVPDFVIFENFCNPLNEENGPTQCAIACIDLEYESRLGTIYPDTINLTHCHEYWDNKRIRLNEVNFDTDNMKRIQIFALVMGMGSSN